MTDDEVKQKEEQYHAEFKRACYIAGSITIVLYAVVTGLVLYYFG